MKKLFGLMVLALLVLCLASAAQAECVHQFSVGNCTSERYCYNCEEWITTNTEHSWGAWDYGTGPHHARYCTNYDCIAVDFGNHGGGTATCTEKAICTVCDGAYGSVNPNAHDWGEWYSTGMQKLDGHSRICKWNDSHYEEEEHIGGNPTCSASATCDDCNETYFDGNNHAYDTTDWGYYDDTKHVKLCKGCKHVVDRAAHDFDNDADPKCDTCGYTRTVTHVHSYSTATCTTPATCSCGATTGGKDMNNHVGGTEIRNAKDATEFTEGYTGDTYCKGCNTKLSSGQSIPATHVHSYSAANCTTPATCSCNATQGDVDKSNHVGGTEIRGYIAPGEFSTGYTGDTYCKGCDTKLSSGQSIPATHVHSYSAATCTTPATCSCNATSGEALGHIPGAAATCTTDQVCTRTGCGEVLNEKLGHAPGAEATCTTDQVCTRTGCGIVLNARLGHTEVIDPAVAPTCTATGLTEGKHCGVCEVVLIAQDVIQANGHSYEAKTVAPTCTKSGYTTHTCSVCGDAYTDNKTSARGHWYDLWIPNGDGTHSADCKRYGCRYVGTTECTLFENTVKDGEAETLLTICPVCGDHEETPFAAILDAVIKAVDRNALPRGELIVHGMDAPFDDVLYAFTAAYEYAGKVEPFKGAVSITLPLDAEKYTEFKLMRVDVTPATEATQRTEVWTDIAFTYEDGKLTFETDVAGLFLLIPAR